MASKIDYKAIFNPILTILNIEDLPAEKKLKMVNDTIVATLEEKTVETKKE